MKNIMFLCLCLFPVAASLAQNLDREPSNAIFSETRKSVFVGFWNGVPGTNKNVTFPVNRPVKYGFGSTENSNYDVFALNDECGLIISAKSESGDEIQKTEAGSRIGRSFSEVYVPDKSNLDHTKGRGNGGPNAPYLSIATANKFVMSRELPPFENLFKFDRSGSYTVQIQMQCFVGPYGKSTLTNVQLVRFPPVVLTVRKN
jgi:hypothetical protein